MFIIQSRRSAKNLILKYLGKSTPYDTFPSLALYLPKFVLPIMRPVYVKKHAISTKYRATVLLLFSISHILDGLQVKSGTQNVVHVAATPQNINIQSL